uniref:WD repeat-containing protein 41-like n=1 Tax=Saccoglossus kowalevskii TaxID=10224 RepID=A0ABM0M1Z0_SACKO|nr:PREDICTED: WD repeat-containing protein 41-like [Saccoglossus kowalevskii]
MSLFNWSANDEKKSNKRPQQVPVVSITDDQPCNPYTEVQVLSAHTDIVQHLLKIDDNRCVSAADDNTAIIWDIQTGKKLATLAFHSRPITSMLVIQSEHVQNEYLTEKVLLTGSSDKTIAFWDLENGQLLHTVNEHNSTVKCLVTWEDCHIFCSAGKDLCVFSHHGILITKFSRQDEDADIQCLLPIKNNRVVVAFQSVLAVYKLILSDEEEVLRVEHWKTLPSSLQHREAIRCLIKISDVSFASGSLDGTIMVWTSHGLNPSREFNFIKKYKGDHHAYPFSVQHMVAIEERYILAAIGSGFCLYDVIKETCLAQSINSHYSKILHINFVYNGMFVATCSLDGTIRLWGSRPINDEVTGNSKSVLSKFMGSSAPNSHDGRSRRRSGDVSVFHPVLLGECYGHSGAVNAFVDFGYDGLVSCGTDQLLLLWKDGEIQSSKRNDIIRQMLRWNVMQ